MKRRQRLGENKQKNQKSMTQTKKKKKEIVRLNNGNLLICSEVDDKTRAKTGVSCMINKHVKKYAAIP